MKVGDLARLLLLAAIWGASFLFIRVAAPVLGSSTLMGGRVALAALFLWLVARWFKKAALQRADIPHYMLLGVVNSALPFMLYAYAAHWLTASVLAVLNATAPIWGLLVGHFAFKEPVSQRGLIGLILGIAGVAILVGFDGVLLQDGALFAVAAGALAAACYGLASHYTRRSRPRGAFDNAHGSMWAATLCLLPLGIWQMPSALPSIPVWSSLLALGIVCTGIAYLLYFRLVSDLGPTKSLTVTFLIPLFGIFWGHVFLGETIGWYTLVGSAMVLGGTALVTGFSIRGFITKTK